MFVITKLMGHKQVAQLDFFDYISGITIGSIAAEMAIDRENFLSSLISLVIYCFASITLSLVTTKFPKSRKYINGTPTIIMCDGKIYRKNLKKAKLDLSEFMLMCREQGYFDLGEVEMAIFEHNGKLSILQKSPHRPATPSDFGINVAKAEIGTEVIMDGRVMGENLERLGYDIGWLTSRVTSLGYNSPRDILLGVYTKSGDRLTLYPIE